MDNEWRQQRENQMGPDLITINSYFAASYYPSQINDLEIFIAFDKPWDEDFQDIPRYSGSRRPVFTWSHLQVVGFM